MLSAICICQGANNNSVRIEAVQDASNDSILDLSPSIDRDSLAHGFNPITINLLLLSTVILHL